MPLSATNQVARKCSVGGYRHSLPAWLVEEMFLIGVETVETKNLLPCQRDIVFFFNFKVFEYLDQGRLQFKTHTHTQVLLLDMFLLIRSSYPASVIVFSSTCRVRWCEEYTLN